MKCPSFYYLAKPFIVTEPAKPDSLIFSFSTLIPTQFVLNLRLDHTAFCVFSSHKSSSSGKSVNFERNPACHTKKLHREFEREKINKEKSDKKV